MLDGFPAKILFLVKKVLFLKFEASRYPIFSQINMPELRYLKIGFKNSTILSTHLQSIKSTHKKENVNLR